MKSEENDSYLYCPICGFKTKYWAPLKNHFKTHIGSNRCILCGKEIKITNFNSYAKHAHYLSYSDENHKILYALIAPKRGRKKKEGDYLKECIDFAIERLSTGEIRWDKK